MKTMAAGFVALYPPHTWIPASAGMTVEEMQQDAAEGLGVSPMLRAISYQLSAHSSWYQMIGGSKGVENRFLRQTGEAFPALRRS